jgi:subfamily B ATP-binding cassette protein MsbA
MFLGVLVAPLIQIVSISTRLGEAAAGIERIQQMLTEQVEEEDQSGTTILKDIRGDIRFEKVGFAYRKDNQTLHDIVLHASPGTLTALVGPSGGGKSTIISLIARFYRQTSGTIWIDDVDLSKVELGSYRSHLGIVLQDPFLFGGTLRENISLGCPNAPLSKIQEACRIAHADEFIERLPDGYETIIGERGVKLSAGQRQRLAIARAVMADPKILILDEATSSLDFESEAIVQDALANLLCNRTTFVVAHRLSTIRQADQILVVENGHVVERGTHDVLYEQRGRYWDLYQKQRGLDKNLFLAPDETAEQIESPLHVAGDK